jgi:glycerol-3-phosphate dehydrogenase subunit C
MRHEQENLDACLKCSVCNTACPVYRVMPQYPGPKYLGPELERMRREGVQTDTRYVEYCLGCHGCDVACPNQVAVSEMIAEAKATHHKQPIEALRDWWFARPALLGRLLTIVPAVSNLVLSLKPVRLLMAVMMRINAKRIFPAYRNPDLKSKTEPKADVQHLIFFPGCSIRYNTPDLGRDVIRLLELNGYTVEVAETDCCGVPALANGDIEYARSRARLNLDVLSRHLRAGAKVVTTCSSCGHMLKSGFGGVLENEPDKAEALRMLAENTRDVGELLSEQSDAGKLNTNFAETPLKLAYHAPCHLRSQGIGRPWYHLLGQIPGVSITDLDAGCCGMSGTYGFKEEKYGISMAIGSTLFKRIAETAPQMVTTECATCRMQIEHGTTLTTIHPVEVMLKAYDRH